MFPDPSTGVPCIDELLTAVLPGDNIVWQVDNLDDYARLARSFAQAGVKAGRRVVYLRFAPHPPLLEPGPGLQLIQLDPSVGFDAFAQEVFRLVSSLGEEVFYIFDNISSLVDQWKTDDSLASFFRLTCPCLRDLATVTYFALTRGQHLDKTVARIRDTTQVLIDVFHHNGKTFLHPIKALGRYAPTMFLPHLYQDGQCRAVFESGPAAEILTQLRSQPLRRHAAGAVAPWDRLLDRLMEYRRAGRDLDDLSDPEVKACRDDLLRMMLGARPQFQHLAETYIGLSDLLSVYDRLIGSGRIGGKAAGMILARKILEAPPAEDQLDFRGILEAHDSFYIGSDCFFAYLVDNDLFHFRARQEATAEDLANDYPALRAKFLAGQFSADVMDQFARVLEYFGQAPIIVRSSSLLEDDFGSAFAGKYESVFCPNQGHLPARLEAFTNAVKQVYASSLSPDALAYRRQRNLCESDEQMAILVQRVAGRSVGPYFMPLVAGVGFSRSPYTWSRRLDPSQGMLRLVVGLGTRAVDRVGGDYPRMVFLSHPSLRSEVDGDAIMRFSQRFVDALDIANNRFVTAGMDEIFPELRKLAESNLLLSAYSDGYIADPVSRLAAGPGSKPVVTLNNLIKSTDFAPVLRAALARLDRAYGGPVDIEFTVTPGADGRIRLNILQCRPLRVPGGATAARIPPGIPSECVLFSTDNTTAGGVCRGIRYVIYVDPSRYKDLPLADKHRLGRLVGRLTNHPRLAGSKMMLMGPGRWGSSNIDLGVNVTFADISNASALVEVARASSGQVPEVSYGTHFFRDLVEAQILYASVYPDRPDCTFNEEFFGGSASVLEQLLPGDPEIGGCLRVIDVEPVAGGSLASLVLDGEQRKAVFFLDPGGGLR